MKCNVLVLYKTRKDKRVADKWVDWRYLHDSKDESLNAVSLMNEGYEVCTGNIIASVDVAEDLYSGETSEFEIYYKCDKCGYDDYPHLPQNDMEVNELLTNVIAEMDYNRAIQARLDQLEALRKEREERDKRYKREYQRNYRKRKQKKVSSDA